MKKESLKHVEAMKLEQAVKVFVTHEKGLRAKFDRMKDNLRLSLETTFSDLPDNGKSFLFEELRDIQKDIRAYNGIRQVLQKRYNAEIRKGQRASGLKETRKFGVNFIFPKV